MLIERDRKDPPCAVIVLPLEGKPHIEVLADSKHEQKAIVDWIVNTPDIFEIWEPAAESLTRRKIHELAV